MHTYITEGNVIVSDRFIEAYKESMKGDLLGQLISTKIVFTWDLCSATIETDGVTSPEQFDQGIVTIS